MGMLVEGEWKTVGLPRERENRFVRSTTTFRDRVTADGSSGFPVEAGRLPPIHLLGLSVGPPDRDPAQAQGA